MDNTNDAPQDDRFWGTPPLGGGVSGILWDELNNQGAIRWEFTSGATRALDEATPVYHTQCLGPEIEWILYPFAEAFDLARDQFWDVAAGIIRDCPGDDEPLPFTDQAAGSLADN